MSDLLYEAEAQLAYSAPAELPVRVLSVSYGEAEASPSPVETVDVAWQHNDRPGVFVAAMGKVGDWQGALDALLRLRVYDVERVYATLGGWPEATPLPTDLPPPRGGFGYE